MASRGFFGDILTVMVIMFVFAVVVIMMYFVLFTFSTELNKTNVPNTSKYIASRAVIQYTIFDGLFVLAYAGFNFAAIIMAFQIRSHPIWFAFFVLITPLFALIAAVLSNVYTEIVTASSELTTAATAYPMIATVMNNLPVLTVLMLTIAAIIIFTKLRTDTQQVPYFGG